MQTTRLSVWLQILYKHVDPAFNMRNDHQRVTCAWDRHTEGLVVISTDLIDLQLKTNDKSGTISGDASITSRRSRSR